MLNRISYRMKQLKFALSSNMSEDDKRYSRELLDIKEYSLFSKLPEFEQKHAVVVSMKMAQSAKNFRDVDIKKSARLGLLHDIGKASYSFTILDKGLFVLLKRFLPFVYNIFAKFGEDDHSNGFFRKFYLHKNHGLVGSKLLKKIGESEDIVHEVATHDTPNRDTNNIYMILLERADSLY